MAPLHASLALSSPSKYARSKVEKAVTECADAVEPTAALKVVLLGNSGVGKTSLVCGREWRGVPPPATIGASFVTVQVPLKDSQHVISLQVWDTAGQERFRCMVPMYMRNASAAIIVFDVTNRQSFEDVSLWESELRRCCTHEPSILLLANKSDLAHRRTVAHGEAVKKANAMRASYVEMSAHDNKFDSLLRTLSDQISLSHPPPPPSSIKLSVHSNITNQSSCCPFM